MLTDQAALNKDRRTGKAPMQHRHFATIASIIAGMNPISPNAQGYKQALIEHFADELRGTNPRFNRERFIKACGGE